MNCNEDLLAPVRPTIDLALRTIIDEACDTFKAEVAQASKEVIRDLNHTLKSMCILFTQMYLADDFITRPQSFGVRRL
jgi:hypothetical protein